MTVKELKEALDNYPDDLRVLVYDPNGDHEPPEFVNTRVDGFWNTVEENCLLLF